MVIDDKTRVSFFAVVVCLPFIVGAILWLASIDSKASAAQEDIRGVKEVLWEIRERVIRIEERQKQLKGDK